MSSTTRVTCVHTFNDAFTEKWKAAQDAATDLQRQLEPAATGEHFHFEDEIQNTLDCIMHKHRVNRAGHECTTRTYIPKAILRVLLQDRVNTRSKTSATPQRSFHDILKRLRARKGNSKHGIITPQNYAQTILDEVLVERLHQRIDSMHLQKTAQWEGGRRFTQALDITHGHGAFWDA